MSDFEIKIKQTQDGSSVKDSLNDLKTIKAEAGDAGKAIGETGTAYEGAGMKARGAFAMMQGGARAAKGEMGGLMEMGRGLMHLLGGGVATAFLAVGAAAAAGWAAGSAIYKHFVEDIHGVGQAALKSKEDFEKLDQAKLGNVRKEVDKLTAAFEETIKQIDKTYSRMEAEQGAAIDRDIAKLKTETQTPEVRKRIADLEEQKAVGKEDLASKKSGAKIEQLTLERQAIEPYIKELEGIVAAPEEKRTQLLEMMKSRASEAYGPAAKQLNAEIQAAQPTAEYIEKLKKGQSDRLSDIEGERSEQRVAGAKTDTARFTHTAAVQGIDKKAAEEEQRAAEKAAAEEDRRKKQELQDALHDDEERARSLPKQINAARVEAQEDTFRGQYGKANDASAVVRELQAEMANLLKEIATLKDQIRNANRAS